MWLELMEFGFFNTVGDLYVDLALIWILSMHDWISLRYWCIDFVLFYAWLGSFQGTHALIVLYSMHDGAFLASLMHRLLSFLCMTQLFSRVSCIDYSLFYT